MPETMLRALMIDDSEDDVLLTIRELKKGGYNPVYERIDTAADMKKALREKQWDIILCDYNMPTFNAPAAIAISKEANLDIPLIVISGTIGEETALECMRNGAHDYFMKGKLSLLCPAIARELEDARIRNKQKQAEQELRQSEEKYRTILENIEDGYYEVDLSGRFTFFNESMRKTLGYSSEELMGMNYRKFTDEKYAKKLFHTFNKVFNTGEPSKEFDWQLLRKDGTRRYIEVSVSLVKDASGNPAGFRGISRDITERKNAENLIRESEAKYRNIFENAMEGIYQVTLGGHIVTVNKAFARMAGYASPQELIDSIKDVSTELYFRPEDRNRFLEIIAEKGSVEGFEVEFIKKDGSVFWVILNARTVTDEQGHTLYNEGLAEDITLRKKAEKQLQHSLESLKRATNTTIQVLVSALESKDPYTAGHQAKSANLACAIAKEMGLDKEIIEGIRMAGIIHDIGKISVPAEILTKPSKLTDIEFLLVKEHAQSGYEMLKDVESPWPLAQIVYQHHERMDGSGYPRKLKGEEIILEARILSVADVVEAMASHRPYRASLGIEAALAEIEKNRGILYDSVVADACLRLFQENGYLLT